jgi:hypothetical protein
MYLVNYYKMSTIVFCSVGIDFSVNTIPVFRFEVKYFLQFVLTYFTGNFARSCRSTLTLDLISNKLKFRLTFRTVFGTLYVYLSWSNSDNVTEIKQIKRASSPMLERSLLTRLTLQRQDWRLLLGAIPPAN